MAFNPEEALRHLLSRLGQAFGTIDEDIGAGETVTAIVRKEGEVVRPADTQCRAKMGKGRCKEEITFDKEADTWVVFCEKHFEVDNKARELGKERLARVSVDA